jgi:hypothetical protein
MTKVGCRARNCGYNNNEECNKINKIDVEGLFAKSKIGTFCQSFKNPLDSDILKAEIAKDMSDWTTKIKNYLEYMSDVITAVKGQANAQALP